MRNQASVLHLDLDAFYASVEQRDKPSLRGKPVVIGGIGQRGVVATASYEARAFGVRSAMPSHEARRRCPNAAFLGVRFDAYREASAKVMGVLRDLSPLVEPLSLDEAFVDLQAATRPIDFSEQGLTDLVAELKNRVADVTYGLTASVGVGTSKFMAKVASEINKPDGFCVVLPSTEAELIAPMSVGIIPGVGPVTRQKLSRIGVETVADLQRTATDDLVQILGKAAGQALAELAFARDDRAVVAEREAKSISSEDTFEQDLVDPAELAEILDRQARQVAKRLASAQLFARTVSIKVRQHDFVSHTRARTLPSGTDRPELISKVARSLLSGVDTSSGIRLLGVGVSGLSELLQEELFESNDPAEDSVELSTIEQPVASTLISWSPGADVDHDDFGPGWVWGAGKGVVTVRFETRETPPGPVRSFAIGDPALHRRR